MTKMIIKWQRYWRRLALVLIAVALLWPVSKLGLAQGETLADIGPDQPRSTAPCDRTLDPGANIQDAIDAVRDKETPYVLCLNPGYYGNIVIKNRRNFTLRGVIKNEQRAVILGLPNDEVYPPESADPVDQHPNDKGILIKIVNGDNITLENLTVDGFYYPDFPEMERKVSVLNRLIWLQHTTNSRLIGNIISHAGGECIRIRTGSHDNEVAYNTIQSCGYYEFKIQPLQRLWKNGEGVYIGTDPYQIRANQINKQAYWGADWEATTDGARNNLIHHNDIFPGAQDDLTPPPINELRDGVQPSDGYGNECVDVKEDQAEIGRLVTLPGVAKAQLINNVIRDNRCQGQFDEDSGALDARGSNNLFEHNHVLGTVRGAALRLGGGDPKPILVEPLLSDPVKACTGEIVETAKWQAYNNRIRNNIFASYYNDDTDFNGRGGYASSDCDEELECDAAGQATTVLRNCGPQKILYVVKTFEVSGQPMEAQAPGAGVCGNVADEEGAADWGRRAYKGKLQPVLFSRVPKAATNRPTCAGDANNHEDVDPPGIRGDCVGALCPAAAPQPLSPLTVSPLAPQSASPVATPTRRSASDKTP